MAAEGDDLSLRSDQLPNSTEHIGIDSSGAETPTASLKGLSMLDKVGFDDADYSVVVKHRGRPPNPWRWEIYRAGRSGPIGQSPIFFRTMAGANKAGKAALKQLLAKLDA